MKIRSLILALIFSISVTAFGQEKRVQNTVTSIDYGPFRDGSSVLQTALTVTTISCKLLKQSATLTSSTTSFTCAASGSSHDCVHRGDGIYNIELAAADVDTLGSLQVSCTSSGTYSNPRKYEVVASASMDVVQTGNVGTPQDVLDRPLSAQTDASKFGGYVNAAFAEIKLRSPIISFGTAQAADATHITLSASDSANNSTNKDGTIVITGGAGQFQSARITAYDASTHIATISCQNGSSGQWIATPDSTSTYVIFPAPIVGGYASGFAPLLPTVAGRTLNVGSSGEIGAIGSGAITSASVTDGSLTSAKFADDATTAFANKLLDLPNGIETNYTFRQMMRLQSSALLGKISGADTGSPVFRDVNDTTNRIQSTTGNAGRSSVTLNPN